MNLNKERNDVLKKIAESLEKSVTTKRKNQKDRRTFVISIISIVISILAVFAAISVPYISYRLDLKNKPLVLGEKINLYFDDENSENGKYNITFNMKQGSLKKAYIANWEDDGCVVYENIIEDLDGGVLSLSRKSDQTNIDMNSENVNIVNVNTKEMYLINGYINKRYIEDFALVLLDTTGQWWIYYFISSPEFVPENVEYNLKLQDEDGKEIINVESEIEKQEMSYVIIDGTLTSVSSIEKALAKLDTDYHLFEKPKTFKGKNDIEITSNPIMIDVYNPPTSANIYDKIIEIHKDIVELSL